jgi:protein N-terminal amidase
MFSTDHKISVRLLNSPVRDRLPLFISELAARLRCHVIAGYPEALPADENDDPRYGAYNSAVICGPGGEYIGGGRKTNMYVADLPWCKPGALLSLTVDSALIYHQVTGLLTSNSRPPLSESISFGICMDLNPHPPNTDDDLLRLCELAEFAIQKNARILVVLCAWLNSGASPDSQWDTDKH